MIIKPRIRGFICTTAHPDGVSRPCRCSDCHRRGGAAGSTVPGMPWYSAVRAASAWLRGSSRAFGCGADTVGVSFEKAPGPKRTATAGWYNNRAFEDAAKAQGRLALTFDGDAFADETRERVIAAISENMGQIDLLVYSLAAPVRTNPRTGEQFRSAIKPLGEPLAVKSLDVNKGEVREIVLPAADEDETAATVQVMGGEDWEWWIDALLEADALAPGFRTVAYSYLGSDLTARIYREGTLGRAKADVDRAAAAIQTRLGDVGGEARVAVLKAIVSQASTAIPVVPLYMSILFPRHARAGQP